VVFSDKKGRATRQIPMIGNTTRNIGVVLPSQPKKVAFLGVLLLIILVAPRGLLISAQSVSSKSASSKSDEVSTATEIRLIDPGWWPTKGTSPRDQYVGSETCARCHQHIVETQKNTPMAHAVKPATADAFTNIPHTLHFRTGSPMNV
jgi:hypothetical protein